MLKNYRDKDGYTFQYEEGTQPEGLEPVEPEPVKPEPKAKQARPANKARTTRTKKAAE